MNAPTPFDDEPSYGEPEDWNEQASREELERDLESERGDE